MPNCFQLTRKSDLAAGPVKLSVIDDELCRHLDVPVDPVRYAFGWFDVIGWDLAFGRTFEQIRQRLTDGTWTDSPEQHLLKCCDYLSQHFTPDSWVEIGKR